MLLFRFVIFNTRKLWWNCIQFHVCLLLKFVTWFHERRNLRAGKRGLFLKSYCFFFETVALELQTDFILFKFITVQQNIKK